ncbi:MAG: TRAP transporter fused permease subunit [Pseudomonadota bacterium]
MKKITPLTWIASAIAVYHLAVLSEVPAFLGFFMQNQKHLAVSVTCALLLIFLLRRGGASHGAKEKEASAGRRRLPWYDYLLMLSTVIGAGYILFFFEKVLDYGMYGELDTTGIIVAACLAVPLLEGIRRTTGWALPIIILIFVAGTIFQRFLPGLLYGRGYPVERLLYSAYVGESGIFGLPLNVAANIVIMFLIFGALMEKAGAGQWFIDMALSLTGWSRGGPAKAAVLSSALFGSISGSPSSNAATTGVFTIPMMKKIGYRPAFAGAVEAVASTGGQILPPVMGSIAFVMAEWIEVSYADVVKAAVVPGILYFLIVFVSVHLQARKDGIAALPRAELPRFWPAMKNGWHYLIPITVLVWLLIVKKKPPGMAAMYSAMFIVLSSFLSRDRAHWLTPARIMFAFESGVKRWMVVAAITGSVGIMIGALELSGVGIKLSGFIVNLAGGNLYVALFLVGAACLITGMGLDAIPAYITLATLMAPALIDLGVPMIAAHLFVVYWGLASFYTPPMCIVVYVTIGISGSKVWETGWEAVKLGIAAFLIPFAFAINKGLMLQGGPYKIILATGTAVIGAVLVASGVRGFLFRKLSAIECIPVLAAGVLFILPGYKLPLTGLGILLAMLMVRYFSRAVFGKVRTQGGSSGPV